MKILNRSYYSNRIKSFVGKGIIKVLTGQWRVGKSYLLLQIMQEIKFENPTSNIVYINKEQEEFRYIKGEEELFTYLKDKINPDKENFLFLDEIQDINGFEHVLRSLQAAETWDIFCTGSNAKML